MLESPSGTLTLAGVLTPEGSENPYPLYRRLLSEAPVFRDPQIGSWVLTRHADVTAASRDARFSAVRLGTDVEWLPEDQREELAPVFHAISRQMLFLDPPDHTRVRGLVHRAFTPRMVEGMRPRVQNLVNELLDRAAEEETTDLMQTLAMPLPAIVIAEMLGVPPEDRTQFQRWSEDFGALLGGTSLSAEQATYHLGGVRDLIVYFGGVVEDHRRRPRNDLLGAMIAAEDAGDRLSADELFANAVLLIAAGHLTTAGLITNGLLTLLQHPDSLRALAGNPALLKSAVEEMLRYESPIQATGRRLADDVEMGGHILSAGEYALLHLGAANRDPEQFEEPDRFDIARPENRHVAFSGGIHFCLGAALARLEGQIALGTVVARFPNVELAGQPPRWETDLISRGVTSLEVALR